MILDIHKMTTAATWFSVEYQNRMGKVNLNPYPDINCVCKTCWKRLIEGLERHFYKMPSRVLTWASFLLLSVLYELEGCKKQEWWNNSESLNILYDCIHCVWMQFSRSVISLVNLQLEKRKGKIAYVSLNFYQYPYRNLQMLMRYYEENINGILTHA